MGGTMNRIQRIAAAAAVGAAVVVPTTATITPAFARPYEDPGTTQPSGLTKAQIEHEELLRLNEQSSVADEQSTSQSTSDSTSIPWDVVGLAAFAGAALGAGTVVGVRYIQRVPKHA
jgi:hypothetical protein